MDNSDAGALQNISQQNDKSVSTTIFSKITLNTFLNHGKKNWGGANISQHRMLKDILGNQKNLILDPENRGKGGIYPKV